MRRYWLFVANRYYPSGGMEDLWGAYDTIQEAMDALSKGLDEGEWVYPEGSIWDSKEEVFTHRFDSEEGVPVQIYWRKKSTPPLWDQVMARSGKKPTTI